ncbi:GGDEF domain-containing protein [Mycobacterium sp. PS03-16]|nr:GGDEF domain-containing protein [Mycobacterium sp. PS03-16]
MSGAIKTLIGLGTGLNAVLSLAILLPFADTPASRVVVALFAALQFGWAWAWCTRPWPSRRTSLAFVVSADIGIAAVAVVDASWLLGLFGFNAFAMISVYLMFFDGPKVMAAHALWILLATTGFAVQAGAAAGFDALTFTASTLAAVAPVVATPLGVQLGIWAMRNDANVSVTDPLTGLLNRRGLHLHIEELVRDAATADAEVTVMVVDLDRFKDVNDTFGHTVGDDVLVRSARRIMTAVRGTALVARIGGEEFVIVDVAPGPGRDPAREFDRVREAIAAPAPHAVTASVGVTCVPVAGFTAPGVDPVALLDTVIERADEAMFAAKRGGGNATVHLTPVCGNG